MDASSTRRRLLATAAVAGGFALIIGAAMSWLTVSFVASRPLPDGSSGRIVTVGGTTMFVGKLALALGILVVVSALLIWFAREGSLRAAAAVVVIAAGLIGAGAALYGAAARANAVQVAATRVSGVRAPAGRRQAPILPRLAARGITPIRSLDAGLFVAVVGGVVAAAGAAGSLAANGSGPSSPRVQPAPVDGEGDREAAA
jgi:hypothetical protein